MIDPLSSGLNAPLGEVSAALDKAQKEINSAINFSDFLAAADKTLNSAAQAEIARAEAGGKFARAMVNPQPAATEQRSGKENPFAELERAAQSHAAARGTFITDAAKKARYEKKVREACQGFETMFLQMMYRQMRQTVPDNTLFGNSNSQKIWQSLLDDKMMENISKAGGVGLADMIYDQLYKRGQI